MEWIFGVLAHACLFGSAMTFCAFAWFATCVMDREIFREVSARNPRFPQMIRHWMAGSLLLEGLAGGIWFWMTCPGSPVRMFGTWAPHGVDGILWIIRAVLLFCSVLIFWSFWTKKKRISPGYSCINLALLGLGAGSLLTLAWNGHTDVEAGRQMVLHLVNTLHVTASAIWPAGLLPLLCFLGRNGISRGISIQEIAIVNRFSSACLVAVAILLLTGWINGWLLMGSWAHLFGSSGGEKLLVKILLVAAMIGMGAYNRIWLMPRLQGSDTALPRLRSIILAESLLGLAVLLIVGTHHA